MIDDKDFEESLAEKFSQLCDKTVAPAELKTEVFKTIDSIKDISEILDLFVIKFPMTKIGVIGSDSNDTDKTKL